MPILAQVLSPPLISFPTLSTRISPAGRRVAGLYPGICTCYLFRSVTGVQVLSVFDLNKLLSFDHITDTSRRILTIIVHDYIYISYVLYMIYVYMIHMLLKANNKIQ